MLNDLGPVSDHFGPFHPGAMSAAEKSAVRLYAVADHLHPAVLAGRSESVNCALETIEGTRLITGHSDFEGLP